MKSNYRLVVLNPYFGRLPEMFPHWVTTCGYNSSIDWIVFTDDKRAFDGTYAKYIPRNVRIIRSSLAVIKTRVEEILGFSVPLYRPYKICDFRPMYGQIFQEYVEGYDFWGYSDLDILWGSIRKFVTDQVLEKYDRIYTNGYLSFYRNTEEVNCWYRTLTVQPGREEWETVFSTEQNWEYDEWAGHRGGGITHIIEDNGKPLYMHTDWANLLPRYGRFIYSGHRIEADNVYFKISQEGIFTYDLKTKQQLDEVCFIHMFKRPPRIICEANEDVYYYLPPNIIADNYKKTSIVTWFYHIRYKTLWDMRNAAGAVKQKLLKEK